ncbi:MAG: amino acid permease [Mobilicoccus sp.]|nr:amino acid permease [Mobilicoccus sp.]
MSTASPPASESERSDLHRNLKNRHIQMIALGGAIGTGLFYGAAGSAQLAGPSVLVTYALGGLAIFLIMRALGEMSWHTPVSGAFSYYATENWGRFPGFFSGWNYWFNYIVVSMAELSVVGIYVNYWYPEIPHWVTAAVFLVVVTCVNLVNVKAFGEFEFWFAFVKVAAIIAMILLGAMLIVGIGPSEPAGLGNLTEHGGFAPFGVWGMLSALVVVMFAFGGVELIGITAGEADDPRRTIPRAINQVVVRILVFYIGALFVILTLVPWNSLDNETSPFVLIFDQLGIPAAATILNVVVLTAAVSAYNSGLYSNGRMLYSLALRGDAPAFLGRCNAAGAPYVGVLVSSCVTALAVVLMFVLEGSVFLVLVPVALMAGIFNWGMILITQIKFRRRIGPEAVAAIGYRMPLFPVANYVVLAFLAFIVFVMTTQETSRFTPLYGLAWLGIVWVGYLVRGSRRGAGSDTRPEQSRPEVGFVPDDARR